MKSLIGQVVSHRYEILEKSGEGRLFTVYRTRDKVMNRLVAVRVLKADQVPDTEFGSRLVERARQLISLSHPNLAKVYEAEVASDATYIAEEHVRGIDLKERVRRIAPFTVSSTVDVAAAVAHAVDYLHRNGIVHGSLRPQKVLIGPEGDVKVTGANLVSAFSGEEDLRMLWLMRTAHYAAPELFQGRQPDERSDIYSLGAIIYEMLTGLVPYDAESPIEVAMMHSRDPIPSARLLNAGVPRALEGIINKALAKDPGERYTSAREMLADLRSIQDSLRVGAPLSWSPQDPARQRGEGLAAEPREESLWKMIGKAVLLVAVVAGIVLAGFMMLVGTGPADIVVPNIVGMSEPEARQRLSQLGLRMDIARQDFNDKYESGEVYFTDPPYGQQVKKKSTVSAYLSKGSRNVEVPSVVGLSESRARDRLIDQGIEIGEVNNQYSASVPAGDVIRQNPKAGTKLDKTKAQVDLFVSLGADPTLGPPPQPEPEPERQPEPEPEPEARPRKLRISFTVPEGDERQVQVVVKDDTGEWTALDETHSGGERVSTTITAVGKSVEIRTLLDGEEVNKQIK